MEQQDLQKRLLLALVLSFMVFVLFDMFMMKAKKRTMDSNNTVVKQQKSGEIPQSVDEVQIGKPSEATMIDAPETTIESMVTVTSDRYIFSIDKMGRIAQAELLEKKYSVNGKPLRLFNPKWVKPLNIVFSNKRLNEEASKTPYSTSTKTLKIADGGKGTVTMTQKLSSLTVTKKLSFYPDGHYDIDILVSKPIKYFVTTGQRPDADHTRFMVVAGSMVRKSNNTTEILEDGEVTKNSTFRDAKFASAFDRYYASILYDFKNLLNVSVMKIEGDNALLFVQGTDNLSLHGYIGPKEYEIFKKINPELTEAIEYGWFTFIAKPLFSILQWFHGLVGNWGWAIILVTILIKLVLFPLSYKGMISMQKLKDLAPQMKELREKYADDAQKMNMKIMELYRKHDANPMGGCLPMLLQIPIFFAIYRVLLNAVELQGAEWILWINDLSLKDPLFVLPILMGVSMWYQQRITPNNVTDPMQQKIFQWLPVIMTIFFITFPSGLVLYWLTNNIFTIIQQYVINDAYEKHKIKKTE